MPGQNLTREEAQQRAATVSTHSYAVTIDTTSGDETFRTVTRIRFSATPGSSTFLDAITAKVHTITLNGRAVDASAADGERVNLEGLAADNELLIDADFFYMNTGEGLHRFVDPVDDEVYLYSQFEVPDSRRVYPVFEQPDLKATFTFSVVVPKHWSVVSNSPVSEVVAADEKKTWHFKPTPRISSYITAIVAGPYVAVHEELTSSDGRTIPLGVYSRASLAEHVDADYIFDKTREGFAFYEKLFDRPYPFEKYDQLFVPEFNAGAMENAGAITFTETYVFRSKVTDAIRERRVVTILHELAHMWFGDLVTMRWWNDLWLNESFAEYMSTLAVAEATEWHEAWTTFASMEKSWAYRQDQLPTTHPIVAEIRDLEDVYVNFDGITYAKGASVLKQLVAWVGRESFFAGVSNYFKVHAFGNTTLADFLHELEGPSGRDLSDWSRKWLETAGVNTLEAAFETDDSGNFTEFSVVQQAPEDYPVLRPHRMAIGLYNLANGRLVRQRSVEVDVDGATTAIPQLVGLAQPDLILLNDGDLSYAKVRLDSRSLETAKAHLGAMPDSLARALVWGAIWDATRDALLAPSVFIDTALEHLGTEEHSTTLRTLLGQLTLAATHYVAPRRRSATVAQVADRLYALAQSAKPGSDAQFQLLTSFAALAATPEQLDAVAGLRSGELELAGLTIDTDLGWQLLTSLAAGGRASEDDIAKALEADPTASGQQSAAQARAAINTPEAKATAWNAVFATSDAPNAIVRATGAGFLRVNDPALLEGFVKPYFEALSEVWSSRSYGIAEKLIVGFYPHPLASKRLAEATAAWLADNPQPQALARLVIENLAGVERALKVQNFDNEH